MTAATTHYHVTTERHANTQGNIGAGEGNYDYYVDASGLMRLYGQDADGLTTGTPAIPAELALLLAGIPNGGWFASPLDPDAEVPPTEIVEVPGVAAAPQGEAGAGPLTRRVRELLTEVGALQHERSLLQEMVVDLRAKLVERDREIIDLKNTPPPAPQGTIEAPAATPGNGTTPKPLDAPQTTPAPMIVDGKVVPVGSKQAQKQKAQAAKQPALVGETPATSEARIDTGALDDIAGA